MASERKFIEENTKRSLIKKFLLKEIEGAGFGGMSIQRTPIGTRVNILVERPGMVIGKGGGKIKSLTQTIQERFNVDNPQIEIHVECIVMGNKGSCQCTSRNRLHHGCFNFNVFSIYKEIPNFLYYLRSNKKRFLYFLINKQI